MPILNNAKAHRIISTKKELQVIGPEQQRDPLVVTTNVQFVPRGNLRLEPKRVIEGIGCVDNGCRLRFLPTGMGIPFNSLHASRHIAKLLAHRSEIGSIPSLPETNFELVLNYIRRVQPRPLFIKKIARESFLIVPFRVNKGLVIQLLDSKNRSLQYDFPETDEILNYVAAKCAISAFQAFLEHKACNYAPRKSPRKPIVKELVNLYRHLFEQNIVSEQYCFGLYSDSNKRQFFKELGKVPAHACKDTVQAEQINAASSKFSYYPCSNGDDFKLLSVVSIPRRVISRTLDLISFN